MIAAPYRKVLINWASVSRTLTMASTLLMKAADVLEGKTSKEAFDERKGAFLEQMDFTQEELDALTIPLDSLHQAWRGRAWEVDKKLAQFKEKELNSVKQERILTKVRVKNDGESGFRAIFHYSDGSSQETGPGLVFDVLLQSELEKFRQFMTDIQVISQMGVGFGAFPLETTLEERIRWISKLVDGYKIP